MGWAEPQGLAQSGSWWLKESLNLQPQVKASAPQKQSEKHQVGARNTGGAGHQPKPLLSGAHPHRQAWSTHAHPQGPSCGPETRQAKAGPREVTARAPVGEGAPAGSLSSASPRMRAKVNKRRKTQMHRRSDCPYPSLVQEGVRPSLQLGKQRPGSTPETTGWQASELRLKSRLLTSKPGASHKPTAEFFSKEFFSGDLP